MKTVFELGNVNEGTGILLIEVGRDHCCYAVLNRENNSISYLKYIGFEDLEAEEKISEVLTGIDGNPPEVLIASSYPQALLVPQSYSGSLTSWLEAVYDLPLQKQMSDRINEWQMTAAWSLPDTMYRQLMTKFPTAQFFHGYTTALKNYNGFVAEDQLEVHLTTQQFRILVKKENQIQLAQTYSYRSPLDVVYILLKLCYELGIDQSAVFVVLSGLIDQDSAMYKELHNYFLNLHFAQTGGYSLPESDLPAHYFTSLYNLAACVS